MSTEPPGWCAASSAAARDRPAPRAPAGGADVGALGAVDLGDHLGHELGAGQVLHLLGHEAAVADDPAAAHEEDLHRRLERILGQPHDVEVLGPVRDHLLGFGRLVHGDDAVTQAGRALVAGLRGGQHLGLQLGQHRLGVAREEPIRSFT